MALPLPHLGNKDSVATDLINQVVMAAHKIRSTFEPYWEENWLNYRVEPMGGRSLAQRQINPYASDINSSGSIGALKTPESHQVANTLTATILASLFGVRDYVQAEGTGNEDQESARRVSQLIMFGLERPGNYRTNYETLKDAVIFGSGFYRASWVTQTRTVPRRMPVPDGAGGFLMNPETGLPLSLLTNVSVPVRDDPALIPISLYDLWLDPGITRLADSKCIVERGRMSRDELLAMKGQPGWESDGIDRLLKQEPTEWIPGPGEDTSPKLTIEGLTKEDIKNLAAFGYYGTWTYTGMCDSQTARRLGIDPSMSYTMTVANGILLGLAQNPQKNGEIPYGSITILPTGGQPYGLSPLTVIRYLQDVSDSQLILTAQAMLEAVYQNYLVGGGAGVDPGFMKNLERRKPRQAFMVSGDVAQIQPLPKDYTGLQIAAEGLRMLSQTMRDASSARDPIQGIMSNDRSTATEVNVTAGAALQNVDQLSALIERDELPREGMLIHGLYYVNLEDDGMVLKRIGDSEPLPVSFWDIDGDYDTYFVGAQQAITKQQKATDFKEMMGLLVQSPMGQASIDFEVAARWFADNALATKGLEDLIIKDPMEVIARMQVMGIKGPLQGEGQPTSTPPGQEAA